MASRLFPLLLLGTLLGILGALLFGPRLAGHFAAARDGTVRRAVYAVAARKIDAGRAARRAVAVVVGGAAASQQERAAFPSLHLWASLGFLFLRRGAVGARSDEQNALSWSVGLALAGIIAFVGWTCAALDVAARNIWPQIPTVALAVIGLAAKTRAARLATVSWAIVAATVVQIGLLQPSR